MELKKKKNMEKFLSSKKLSVKDYFETKSEVGGGGGFYPPKQQSPFTPLM